MHEALRQRIGVHYHLEGLTREGVDAHLMQQFESRRITQPRGKCDRNGLSRSTNRQPKKM